jgi:hypothetical protein
MHEGKSWYAKENIPGGREHEKKREPTWTTVSVLVPLLSETH